MRILGIDPGIAITGYGVIEKNNGDYTSVGHGVIRTSNNIRFSARLEVLYNELMNIIDQFKPDEIAIEELFFSKNTKTAIMVSQARGVAILSTIHKKKPLFEYTPLQVKQGITGYGRADKHQVTKMVTHLLGLEKPPKPDDAADAIAVAICHANHRKHHWINEDTQNVI